MVCNLACKHCSRAADTNRARHPALSDVLAILDRLNPEVCSRLLLLGGEPLIYPHIDVVLASVMEKGLPFRIVTNGQRLTDGLISLAQEAHCSEITVSLDGPDRSSHEYIRGKRTFERALGALRSIRRAFDGTSNRVGISYTLMARNVHRTGEIIELARRLGVDVLYLSALEEHGRATSHYDVLGVTMEDYIEAVAPHIDEIARPSDSRPSIRWGFLDTPLRMALRHSGIELPIPLSTCPAATTEGVIDSQGRLWPCALFSVNVQMRQKLADAFRLSDNSLLHHSVDEIWESDGFRRVRDLKAQRLHLTHGNPCRTCGAKNLCSPCFLPHVLGEPFNRPDCLQRRQTPDACSGPLHGSPPSRFA